MTAGPLLTLPASRSAWIWPYLQPVAHLHKCTGWVEGPCATGQQVGTVVSMQQLHEVHALSSDVLPCPVALLSPFHRGRPGQLWEMGAQGGEQVRDCGRSLCSGCPPRGPIPVGLSAPCSTEAAGPWHLLGSLADVVQAEGGQVVLGTHKQASTLLIHQQRFVAAGPR